MINKNKHIKELLNDTYTDSVQFHTHVSIHNPKGKYTFSRNNIEDFFNTYDYKINNGIAERFQSNAPLLVDFDIKVEKKNVIVNGDNHIYKKSQVNDVISIFNSVIRNTIDNVTDETLICCVLEKDAYEVTKNTVTFVKSGFHLHYPHLFCNTEDIVTHIYERVKIELKDINIFSEIGLETDKLLDTSIYKNPWLIYGATKESTMQPYLLSRIVSSELNDLSIEETLSYYQIYNERGYIINMKENIDKYLPQIFSIIPCGRASKNIKRGLAIPNTKTHQIKKKKTVSEILKNKSTSVVESLEQSKELLKMLAPFRYDDYNEWLLIGWILYNIGEGCEEACNQWCEFSSKSDSYDEDVCTDEWSKMTKKDLTIGTLKFFAKTDNETAYKAFVHEQGIKHIKESIEGSHNDIAKLLFNDYGTEFICASVLNKTWYQYIDNVWEDIEEGTFLREKISNDLVSKYGNNGFDMVNNINSDEDKPDAAKLANQLKCLQKLVCNLKNSTFKSSVMKEACEVFYNKSFKYKLDMDPYLIAFENGVYDLKANVFRLGRPSDYLSKKMPITYINYTNNDPKVKEVHDFLLKIFPDTSVRKYWLDQTSDIFEGGNHQKVVLFYLGEGDNGKSVTQSILEKMLGPLAIKFSTTLITGKKNSLGAAAPELARAGGGVRLAVLEEPDGDEEINIGILKSLSGNDSYWARDLFEKGKSTKEITPLFKLIFIANKLPMLKHSDQATWNRIRVIPFESTFVKNPKECPETLDEQLLEKRFLMDTSMSSKIPSLLSAFAWVLLEHRKNITNRFEPEKVRLATDLYRQHNDIYRQFVEEKIKTDEDGIITLTELYAVFKEWFKEGFNGRTLPIKNEVKTYFSKLWGSTAIKWSGYRLRNDRDDVNDGLAIEMNDDDFTDFIPL